MRRAAICVLAVMTGLAGAFPAAAKPARCFTTDDGYYNCDFRGLDRDGSFEISARGYPTYSLWIDGPDENARRMGLKPLLSGERSEDEGLFVCQHEYWAQVMREALAAEKQGEAA